MLTFTQQNKFEAAFEKIPRLAALRSIRMIGCQHVETAGNQKNIRQVQACIRNLLS
jgi:hypothetical protein